MTGKLFLLISVFVMAALGLGFIAGRQSSIENRFTPSDLSSSKLLAISLTAEIESAEQILDFIDTGDIDAAKSVVQEQAITASRVAKSLIRTSKPAPVRQELIDLQKQVANYENKRGHIL